MSSNPHCVPGRRRSGARARSWRSTSAALSTVLIACVACSGHEPAARDAANDAAPCGDALDGAADATAGDAPTTDAAPDGGALVPVPTLLLHYPFEEGSGTIVSDASGRALDGTLSDSGARTASGRDGRGLAFTGSELVSLPSGIFTGVDDFTIAAWVRVGTNATWARIFDLGNGLSGPDARFLYLTVSAVTAEGTVGLHASMFGGSANREAALSTAFLPTDVWKHVAVTGASGHYTLYVDGFPTRDLTGGPDVRPSELEPLSPNSWLGRSRFQDPGFTGSLDDVRIYSRALDAASIQDLAWPKVDYSYYRFDEGRGDAVSDSSSRMVPAVLLGSGGTWTEGRVGGAVELPGAPAGASGAHVSFGASPIDGCTSELTIAAWIKPHRGDAWTRVYDFGDGTSRFMYLTPNDGDGMRFAMVSGSGAFDLEAPSAVPVDGRWHHVAVTVRSATQAKIYLDGAEIASGTSGTARLDELQDTHENWLGRSRFSDPYFQGSIDELRIACRAYTPDEIVMLSTPEPAPAPDVIAGNEPGVHDPSIIGTGTAYYVFGTGEGLPILRSTDLSTWTSAGTVFAAKPAWITTTPPDDMSTPVNESNILWAPDISYFGGKYHLYYAASSFGSRVSCIGHATSPSLEPAAWTDTGAAVICSSWAVDWNAIDPAAILDDAGNPWLALGSWSGGLRMIPLDASGARLGTSMVSLATRADTAVEAPFVVHRGGYYYLFESVENCCNGSNSSYRQVVGRSPSVTGPYVDRGGVALLAGGGTPLVEGGTRYKGPGHNSVLRTSTGDYYDVYHAYDAMNGGAPVLRIARLRWTDDGWPIVEGP